MNNLYIILAILGIAAVPLAIGLVGGKIVGPKGK